MEQSIFMNSFYNNIDDSINNDFEDFIDLNTFKKVTIKKSKKEFKKKFKCYVNDFLFLKKKKQMKEIRKINKLQSIIIPKHCLEELIQLNIDSPFQFEIISKNKKKCYSSVYEYSNEPSNIYIPSLLMDKLNIANGDTITLKSINIPKAVSCTFETLKDFEQLENPKLVLNKNIRDNTFLYENQNVIINFANKIYILTVKELQPEKIVSINNTDLNIKFKFF